MSATKNFKSATNKIVGALIITAALSVGAAFGSLTSPDVPANATIPTVVLDEPCTALICTASNGSGGSVPTKGR